LERISLIPVLHFNLLTTSADQLGSSRQSLARAGAVAGSHFQRSNEKKLTQQFGCLVLQLGDSVFGKFLPTNKRHALKTTKFVGMDVDNPSLNTQGIAEGF
jgi:hypothetical protein